MKLYTEEQLLKAIQLGRNYGGWVTTEPEILKQLTPIELPSDDELLEYINDKNFVDKAHKIWFNLGAKWMRTQILNQNK